MITLFYPICTQTITAFDKNYTTKKWSSFITSLQKKLHVVCNISIPEECLEEICYKTVQDVYKVDTSSLQISKQKAELIVEKKVEWRKTITECKQLTIAKLREHIIEHITEIKVEHPTLKDDDIHTMKKDKLSELLVVPKKKVAKQVVKRKSSEKASALLQKEMNKIESPVNRVPLVNFKSDNPVDIQNDTFWKVKISTFLYISEDEEEEDLTLEHHALTGFLFNRSTDKEVQLFGQLIDGEVVRWEDLEEPTIIWAQRCRIQVDL